MALDKKFKDAGQALEKELRELVAFVEQRVVPAARRDTHLVLRRAARELDRLADKIEKEKTIKDMKQALEKELQELVAFVRQRVVPAARRDTHLVLRRAAGELNRLADKLEKEK